MKKRINHLSAGFLALAFCNAVAAAVFILPSKANASELQNDYLTVCVQDNNEKPAYGSFTLHKTGDSNKDTLTYSQFYSSYTTININGSTYRYGDGKVVKKPYNTEDGHIVTVQDFDGVEVTQSLSLSTGNSSKEDMLLAEYTAKNNTGSDALISMRIIIDPTLSGSEKDLIQVKGQALKNETAIKGNDVADDWCIKDEAGNITAYGILNSGDKKPDMFQAANWDNLYNTENDYVVDGTEIKDNAVAMTWSGTTISDGSTMECETKYGLYSEESEESSIVVDSNSIEESSDSNESVEDSISKDPSSDSSSNDSVYVSNDSDSSNSSESNLNSSSNASAESSADKPQGNSDSKSPNTGLKAGFLFGAGALLSLAAAIVCSLKKRS